jgi:hypothetical protein
MARVRRLPACVLAITLATFPLYSQKGKSSGGGNGSSPDSSGNGNGAGNSSGGNQPGQQSASSSPGTSGRIEAAMLAYEESNRIATFIASQVSGRKLFVYDAQSFANLQAYDAYSATLSAFEMAFNLLDILPSSSFVTAVSGVQTVASALSALRSSAEYATETVDFQTDALIAQVAAHLPPGSMFVPRVALLAADDVQAPGVSTLPGSNCADISETVPQQLGCLLRVRASHTPSPPPSGTSTPDRDAGRRQPFQDLDKLFQVFFGTLMGTSVNLASNSDAAQPPGRGGRTDSDSQSAAAPQGNASNQSTAVPLLSTIIQGRRLKLQLGLNMTATITPADVLASATTIQVSSSARFAPGDSARLEAEIIVIQNISGTAWTVQRGQAGTVATTHPAGASIVRIQNSQNRILLLEATTAGGGSRTRHVLWAELFGSTPTPTFTGGSIVTWMLIDPATSGVEKGGVLRSMSEYGKFHGGVKVEAPRNFP